MPARAGREICGRAAVAWQCQNAGTLYLHGAPNMAVSSSLGLRGVWWTVNPFKGCVVEVPCKVGAKGEQWAACRRWVPWLCSYTGRGLASLRSQSSWSSKRSFGVGNLAPPNRASPANGFGPINLFYYRGREGRSLILQSYFPRCRRFSPIDCPQSDQGCIGKRGEAPTAPHAPSPRADSQQAYKLVLL
jgi:hypothetical protein